MDLRVLLTAVTPLSFRDGVDLVTSDLNRYVPGTAFLGALAEAHAERGRDRDEFANLFLRERVRFGNAYPAHFTHKLLRQANLQPVRPIPLSARSGKRFPGFRADEQDPDDRCDGVTDGLIPLTLFALSGETRPDLLDPLRSIGTGAKAQDLDRISGFYRRGETPGLLGRAHLSLDLRTRTGINYRTGTVQQAILYSTQVLPEGSQFWAAWHLPDGDPTLYAALEALVEDLSDADALRLGNNRTRGFGRVRLQLNPEDDAETGARAGALAERVTHFTAQLATAAAAARIDLPDGVYLPITLTSDMLLHDALLRARLQLSGADLAAAGVKGADLVFYGATSRRVRGWNSVLGLPRADTWAIGMGAVFLFRLPPTYADWDALVQLQAQGLGLRRSEGYGQISLADPFHLELAGGIIA